MNESLLPAVQKAYDLNRWLLPQLERWSRRYKFSLGRRVQETALDLCLALIEAGHAQSKPRPLYRANRLLDQLRILLRLAHDLHLLSARRHEYVTGHVDELGRMIGGWLRSTSARRRTLLAEADRPSTGP